MGDEPVDVLLDDDPAVRRVAWHLRPRSLTSDRPRFAEIGVGDPGAATIGK
jgi:hypothetical protein